MKRTCMLMLMVFSCTIMYAQENNDVLIKKADSLFFDEGKKKEAFPMYLQVAETGNRRMERIIGLYYYHGWPPVEKNYALAFEWYKKAADKGDGSALNNIGLMYKNGLYVTQSKEKAFEYYMKASEAGDPYGSTNVGIMYWDSEWGGDDPFPPRDKTKNYAIVPDYYNGASASVDGGGYSEHELLNEDVSYVQLIIDNDGKFNFDVVPVSPEEEFFLKGAKGDSAFSMHWLAKYYDWKQCDDNFMTFRFGPDRPSEDGICVLYNIAARNGRGAAQANLAAHYMSCYEPAERDYAKALEWLEKAKKNGCDVMTRTNMQYTVEAAMAVCKHMKKTTEYHIEYMGGCTGPDIAMYEGKNGCVYIVVINKQDKAGIVKINSEGRIISKTPIKYDVYDLNNRMEMNDNVLYFDGSPL